MCIERPKSKGRRWQPQIFSAWRAGTVMVFTDAREALDWLGAFDLTPETMHSPEK